jgi:ERCC4-type nuclease
MDPGYQQVKKLCSSNGIADVRQCIKERKNKKKSPSGICFELLADGRENALNLQIAAQNGTAPVGPLRQLCADEVNEEYGNVTMVMDFREGGGGSHGLHKICDLLDQHGIPYVVRELKISDYVFFVRNKLAPIIIERKTVDDVANSLADGRWERQKRNMRKAQLVLGGKDRKCQMCYLIEGDTNKRIVHGGNVGRASWNQSSEDVENAINELPRLGFSVIRSKSHMGSVVLLAQVARDVSWKAENGSIDAELTYPEFLEKMKHVPEKEGDPPTEARHQFPAAPVVDDSSTTNQAASTIPLASSTATGLPPSNDFPSHDEDETNPIPDQASEDLKKLSLAKLKTMCKDRDEKLSGAKKDLIARLLKPRKPELLILRSKSGQYVPKVPSCNAALLVALLLNHRSGSDGLAKENIMLFAEETGISKEPIGGNGGWYDGWAGMKVSAIFLFYRMYGFVLLLYLEFYPF